MTAHIRHPHHPSAAIASSVDRRLLSQSAPSSPSTSSSFDRKRPTVDTSSPEPRSPDLLMPRSLDYMTASQETIMVQDAVNGHTIPTHIDTSPTSLAYVAPFTTTFGSWCSPPSPSPPGNRATWAHPACQKSPTSAYTSPSSTLIPTFPQLLTGDTMYPYTMSSFRSYLVNNFRQESLDFYLAVQSYRKLYSEGPSDDCHYAIHHIAKTFLLPTSPSQVNLPSDVRDKLLIVISQHLPKHLVKQSPSLPAQRSDSHRGPQPEYVPPCAFDCAVACVVDMLREGSFHDWIQEVWMTFPSSCSAIERIPTNTSDSNLPIFVGRPDPPKKQRKANAIAKAWSKATGNNTSSMDNGPRSADSYHTRFPSPAHSAASSCTDIDMWSEDHFMDSTSVRGTSEELNSFEHSSRGVGLGISVAHNGHASDSDAPSWPGTPTTPPALESFLSSKQRSQTPPALDAFIQRSSQFGGVVRKIKSKIRMGH